MPAEKQGPDAAILSDMAKQLEAALKRPAMPVPPPPMAPAPIAPQPVHNDGEDHPHEPGPVHEEPVTANRGTSETEERAEEPEPVRASEPFIPAPPPMPAQPAPPPPARAMETAAASPQASDPFSVEDIEAEFARLLGRPLDPGKKG